MPPPRHEPVVHTSLCSNDDGVWDSRARPIANVADPVLPQDAATKTYVDHAAAAHTSGFWQYQSTLTIADPGSGRVRFNAADISQITIAAFSTVTDNQADFTAAFSRLLAGDRIAMQHDDNAAMLIEFTLAGLPVDRTGWWEMPVTLVSEPVAGFLVNNKRLLVVFSEDASVTRTELVKLLRAGG